MREIKFIYQCMNKAAPWYLPVNLINIGFTYFIFFGSLLIGRYVINCFIYEQTRLEMLIAYIMIYGVILFISSIGTYFITNIFNPLQEIQIAKYMSSMIYRKCNEIDIECYQEKEFYDKYVRAVNDAPKRVIEAKNLMVNVIMAFLKITTIIGLFSTMNFTFTVVSILFCAVSFITVGKMNKLSHDSYIKETPIHRKAEYINRLFRNSNYAKEIKIYRIQDFLVQKFIETKEQLISTKEYAVHKLLRILFSANALSSTLRAFTNMYVIYLIIQGELTVGDFTVVYASVVSLSDSISAIFNSIPEVKRNIKLIEAMKQILDYVPKRRNNPTGKLIEVGSLVLTFRDVDFAYPCNPDYKVLNKINLTLHEGEKLAIVGLNGSGKSTFIKLLLGLYLQDQGSITLNNLSYDNYKTEEFRKLFGVVFQDYAVHSISIAENILFKSKLSKAEEDAVWEALEFSGLAEKVRKLPNTIYCPISKEFDENGIYLSGGEYQRLAIARAYVKNSRILIMDEPTSALDPIAESDIMERLYKLGKDKMVICISHRLSSTIYSDRIAVFEQGRIVECGSHEDLMNKKGVYYSMFQKQAKYYKLD
ncbi:MAG: ABC transporter ATP-binding protein [Lachnospiraceae bacterium]|nr:ABC transporter ATP-binding protein [Lachnospiraceae bacterium]